MTTINIDDEVAGLLERQADAIGVSVADYLRRVAEKQPLDAEPVQDSAAADGDGDGPTLLEIIQPILDEAMAHEPRPTPPEEWDDWSRHLARKHGFEVP